mmetsp:Transcript_8623/g.25904  ORF Transcript_8623/g.25904 Transcript_8623/m.25904 type:complete len:213 (-) Transcript_8623:804-1442(-)
MAGRAEQMGKEQRPPTFVPTFAVDERTNLRTRTALCAQAGARCSRRAFLRGSFLLTSSAGVFLSTRPANAAGGRASPKEVQEAVRVQWPEEFPFTQADFRRYDETSDFKFYDEPKLVYHIDDGARQRLGEFYRSVFARDRFRDRANVLDLCSSWVSYLPSTYSGNKSNAVVAGVGMNEEELRRNPQLTEWIVQDLNVVCCSGDTRRSAHATL